MEKNLISVIMGVYNIPEKSQLEKSIKSIINQTYSNFEFIIIDDGSTNNTYEWLNEISKEDVRIRIFKNEKNMGIQKTLNKAII
jgi:glycosyltransferase involved in cell wall biosynthesis